MKPRNKQIHKRPKPVRPKLSPDDFNQRLHAAASLMYRSVVEHEDRVQVNVLGGRATTIVEVTVVDDDVRFALGKKSCNTEAIRRILIAIGKKQGITVELNVFSAAKKPPVYRARGVEFGNAEPVTFEDVWDDKK